MRFWIPWGIGSIVTAVAMAFFVAGLADGTVSSFNLALWLGLLALTLGVTGGSLWLRRAGRTGLAILLSLVLAIPGLLAGLFILLVLVTHPRWN
jgi:hypothetical protein